MWMGGTEKRSMPNFEGAAAHAPILLFFDEVDSLVTARQPLGPGGDPVELADHLTVRLQSLRK
jgi:ATP-dependent 26S proteasome regulatory subunit